MPKAFVFKGFRLFSYQFSDAADFDHSYQVGGADFVFAWQNKIGQGSKTGNTLLIVSKKYPLFANQTALPANQSQKPAKNLANQKGECTRFRPVMPNTILYSYYT